MLTFEVWNTILVEPSGYFRKANEKMSIITRRSLAYESRSSVARVATGLPLLMSLANRDDLSLIKITMATSIMT